MSKVITLEINKANKTLHRNRYAINLKFVGKLEYIKFTPNILWPSLKLTIIQINE